MFCGSFQPKHSSTPIFCHATSSVVAYIQVEFCDRIISFSRFFVPQDSLFIIPLYYISIPKAQADVISFFIRKIIGFNGFSFSEITYGLNNLYRKFDFYAIWGKLFLFHLTKLNSFWGCLNNLFSGRLRVIQVIYYRFSCIFPSQDTTFEVHALIANIGQLPSGIGRTTTTSAKYGYPLLAFFMKSLCPWSMRVAPSI